VVALLLVVLQGGGVTCIMLNNGSIVAVRAVLCLCVSPTMYLSY
jgi:hypothetical protein